MNECGVHPCVARTELKRTHQHKAQVHLRAQTYNWREDEIHSYRSQPGPCDSEPSIQPDRRRMWNRFAAVSDLTDGCDTLYIWSKKRIVGHNPTTSEKEK